MHQPAQQEHGHIPTGGKIAICLIGFALAVGLPVLGYIIAGLVLVLGTLNAAGAVYFPLAAMIAAPANKQAPGWAQRFGDLGAGIFLIALATMGLVAGADIERDKREKKEAQAEAAAQDEAARQAIIAERKMREAELIAALPRVERQVREQNTLLRGEIEAGNYTQALDRASQVEAQLVPIHDVDWPSSLLDVEREFDELHEQAETLAEAHQTMGHLRELMKISDEKIASERWLEADAVLQAIVTEAKTMPRSAPEEMINAAVAAILAAAALREAIAPNVAAQAATIEQTNTTRSSTYRRRRGPGRGK